MINPRPRDDDDDGSGTVGTVHNNAWLQAILDAVDARWSRVTITATGSQNNLDISQADLVIFNNATDLTITGILAPSSPAKPGKPLRYVCTGAGNVFFADEALSTASTAANRILCIAKSGKTPHAGGSGSGTLVYDDAASRWRLIQHEQGASITATYAGGNFTGNGSMSWTVGSGDVGTMTYMLRGRRLAVDFVLSATSVGGTPNTTLQIGNGAWGGFSAAKSRVVPMVYSDNGGTDAAGFVQIVAASTTITMAKMDVSNWGAATNTTSVFGSLDFEVQ